MVEIIGDIVMPSVLILPHGESLNHSKAQSGQILISGEEVLICVSGGWAKII